MGVHDGYKEKLKRQFIGEGAENFAAHNLLELLLFYAVPRRDTNITAHLLLRQFGDVQSVLSAPINELCKVDGVSKSSAVLIHLCSELGTRFCAGLTEDSERFRSYDDIGEHLVGLYAGVTEETVYALLLSGAGALIKTVRVCVGSVNSAVLRLRDVIAAALSANAAAVVLAHNHPGGATFPSPEDLDATNRAAKALSISGVELAEHFVVAGRSYRRLMSEAAALSHAPLKQHLFFPDDSE